MIRFPKINYRVALWRSTRLTRIAKEFELPRKRTNPSENRDLMWAIDLYVIWSPYVILVWASAYPVSKLRIRNDLLQSRINPTQTEVIRLTEVWNFQVFPSYIFRSLPATKYTIKANNCSFLTDIQHARLMLLGIPWPKMILSVVIFEYKSDSFSRVKDPRIARLQLDDVGGVLTLSGPHSLVHLLWLENPEYENYTCDVTRAGPSRGFGHFEFSSPPLFREPYNRSIPADQLVP